MASIKVRRFTKGKGSKAREVEEIEYKLCDKNEALVALIRMEGGFLDKLARTDPSGQRPPEEPELTDAELVERLGDILGPALAAQRAQSEGTRAPQAGTGETAAPALAAVTAPANAALYGPADELFRSRRSAAVDSYS